MLCLLFFLFFAVFIFMPKKSSLSPPFVDPYPSDIEVTPIRVSFSFLPDLVNVTDNAKFAAIASIIGLLLSTLIRKYL